MQNGQEFERKSYQESQRNETQIVVIGAGLAGLAAAQRLYEAGFRDVLVLDALERIGGRVHTVEHDNYLLELGAQWLHGADDNPLYKWLTELNMLDDFEDASRDFRGLFCTSDKKQLELKLVERVLDIVIASKLSLSKDQNYIDLVNTRGLKNAGEVFRDHLELSLKQDDNLAKEAPLVRDIFEWFLRYETIENSCNSMDEVSIASYTDWTDWGDGTLLNFKLGYKSILNWFCSRFPAKEWIKLSKQVMQVEIVTDQKGQSSSGHVLVHYKHSSGNLSQTIKCNHVIVTCSLGFLKHNQDSFFKPPLPSWRKELINSVGYGTVNKIFLHFESSFWDQCKGIKLIWRNNDKEAVSDANKVDNKQLPAWTRDIIAFDTVRRQPNVLLGWIGGQGAKQMEEFSDKEVGEICLKIFDIFLPGSHKRPSKLIACQCSRWNSNPFTRGSYSFQSMRSLNLKVDKLHEPIYSDSHLATNSCNEDDKSNTGSSLRPARNTKIARVLFAGEATAGKLYSTAHGAIITGWREADRLRDQSSAKKI